jgi:hypothetical protein
LLEFATFFIYNAFCCIESGVDIEKWPWVIFQCSIYTGHGEKMTHNFEHLTL